MLVMLSFYIAIPYILFDLVTNILPVYCTSNMRYGECRLRNLEQTSKRATNAIRACVIRLVSWRDIHNCVSKYLDKYGFILSEYDVINNIWWHVYQDTDHQCPGIGTVLWIIFTVALYREKNGFNCTWELKIVVSRILRQEYTPNQVKSWLVIVILENNTPIYCNIHVFLFLLKENLWWFSYWCVSLLCQCTMNLNFTMWFSTLFWPHPTNGNLTVYVLNCYIIPPHRWNR